MKKIISSLLLAILPFIGNAQVTFEKEFDGILTYAQINGGHKLVAYFNNSENTTRLISVYNLDNSLYKTFSLNVEDIYDKIIHISDNFVNNDDKIEVMFNRIQFSPSSEFKFFIMNEDGNTIFSVDDFYVRTGADANNPSNYFLEQTRDGNKLILSNSDETKSRYYSLGNNDTFSNKTTALKKLKKPYPVPATDIVNINYNTPVNDFTQITIYSTSGNTIETFKMDDQFNNLKLNISNYSSGVYLYQIDNSNGTSKGKFIVN